MPASSVLNGPNATAASRWRLVLLGLPRLTRDEPAAALRLSPKDAALLALVALDGPVASEHVAGLLWPAVDGHKADTSLRQRLFRLRRECGANVVATGSLLQLAPDVDTDLGPTLSRIAIDAHARRDELLGDFEFDELPDLSAWLSMARARWREQRDATMAAAAAQCESNGAIARWRAPASPPNSLWRFWTRTRWTWPNRGANSKRRR